MQSELFPGIDVIPAMKIYKQPAPNVIEQRLNSGDYLIQEKIDGAWFQLMKENDKVYLFGRSPSTVTKFYLDKADNVPHIVSWAQKYVPNNTTLIGEIAYPGGHSNDATKVMGCKSAEAVRRQAKGIIPWIHYYIHDCIQYKGELLINEPFEKRYNLLYNENLFLEIFIHFLKAYDKEKDGDLNEVLNKILKNGGEGIVAKLKTGKYFPDKRPMDNFKVKKVKDDIDLVITKLIDPERYYTGKESESWPYLDEEGNLVTKAWFNSWKNAVEISGYDDNGNLIPIGTVSSGISDMMKEDMSLHPENYLNKVASFQCMEVAIAGNQYGLRHCFFVNMRPDKSPLDCKLSEL